MSNQLVVIGITGVARSGKDTIARILCSRFGFTRIALADGMRSAFRDLDGPTWELTKELEAKGKTTRWALQTIGSDAGEDVADLLDCDSVNHAWVHLLAFKMMYLHRHHPARCHRFVIPDMRFPHEQDAIGTLVLNADGEYQVWKSIRAGSGLGGEAGKHKSETDIDAVNPHIVINNNGSLLSLESVVFQLASQFLGE